MMVTIPKESYPLAWPERWPRTAFRRVSPFGRERATTIASAVELVAKELRRLGASGLIISSNLRVRLDGVPYSQQAAPQDPGIAVYFELKGKPRVLACDRWTRVEHNLWAIGRHIEALRGQERWGVGSVEQAFAGYTALPEKAGGVSWWEVLGVPINASEEAVREAYLIRAKKLHPDVGGDAEKMTQLNEAYRMATSQRTQ